MSRVVVGDNKITNKYTSSHKGVDIGNKGGVNDNIIAHSDGIVINVVKNKKNDIKAKGIASYGNYVKIKHYDGYYTLYAHLDTVDVVVGQKVFQGQKIGYMGNSGCAYGKHLHFELRNPNDKRINPTKYLYEDLPKLIILYQTYDLKKKKWLPNVIANSNNYAGNIGNSVGALYIDNLIYRVHDLEKKKWLPFVNGRSDYAGNKKAIDGLQIKDAIYRVHIKNESWLPWVFKVDNTNDGYAGIYGKEIDLIQIKLNN